MAKLFTIRITKTSEPRINIEGTDARDPLPQVEGDLGGYLARSFGADGIYSNLSSRLQEVADRLYYTPNQSYGQTPKPEDPPEDYERSYSLTDFSFATRPYWAGGGFSFDVWED